MQIGAITSYIDVAQLAVYVFFLFFAGLIYYLHRENKREGYPLETDQSPRVRVEGYPPMPRAKTYHLGDGRMVHAPRASDEAPLNGIATSRAPGSSFEPVGNKLLSNMGAAAYAQRGDHPDNTMDHLVRIIPLRADPELSLAIEDSDPRGKKVVGADRAVAGVVVEAWVDRVEMCVRYLELELVAELGGHRVLLPFGDADTTSSPGLIRVRAILGHQFAHVPATKSPDQVTLLEEDRICAYYGGGLRYATAARSEPLL